MTQWPATIIAIGLAQARSDGLEVPNVPSVLCYRPIAREVMDARDVQDGLARPGAGLSVFRAGRGMGLKIAWKVCEVDVLVGWIKEGIADPSE
jgi:hypothetical protein